LIRLVSLLNGCVLMDLSAGFVSDEKPAARAFEMELIDAESLDEDSLTTFYEAEQKVELIFQWIQGLVVEACNDHLFSVAPPIVSRVFQELAAGMVCYHQALKIAKMPLPFPYVQSMELLLVLHWIITPPLMCMWVTSPMWTGILTFAQVFFLWCLNTIATELENPFGDDVNDLPAEDMQKDLNRRLLMLIEPASRRTPQLTVVSEDDAVHLGCSPQLSRTLSRTALGRSGSIYSSVSSDATEACKAPDILLGRQKASDSPFQSEQHCSFDGGVSEGSLEICRPALADGPMAAIRAEPFWQLRTLPPPLASVNADPIQPPVVPRMISEASDSNAEAQRGAGRYLPDWAHWQWQISGPDDHKRASSKGGLPSRDIGSCECLAELVLICRELRDHVKASPAEQQHSGDTSSEGLTTPAERMSSRSIGSNRRPSTLGSAAEAAAAAARKVPKKGSEDWQT